ncbi:MAG: recombinase RecA [Firmicutes bacterium]|nr:recombinase RecA [Bacillota bacterium]
MTPEDKAKALDFAISQIEKSFGKGSIMKLSESRVANVEAISTGCLPLDMALGIGGLPRGRIVEIYGPESSGKTTLSLHAIAETQKLGGTVAFIDAEHALDPIYATNLGIDLANMYVSQPDNGEQALDITESLIRSGALDLIVIDSVAALTPRAEIDGDMGDSHMGLQARLMSQALRKLAGICYKTRTCIIFINQLREKMGGYGNPEVTPGGKALKFYASVRLDVRKGEAIKTGTEQVGSRTKVKVVKNKLAPPFRIVEFDLLFGKGINKQGSIIDLAVEHDIIKKSGSWFSYNDERMGQGREAVKQLLEERPQLYNEIEAKIRALAASVVLSSGAEEDESDE